MPRSITELAELISEMPGIGPRQAKRVVQFLLRSNPKFRKDLVEKIESLGNNISQCKTCFRYDEVNNEGECSICSDATRDTKALMVLEKDVDIDGVETAGVFKGKYFVLGSLMSLTNTRRSQIAPRVNELMRALKSKPKLQEVILAFATTPEGDYTARELKKKIDTETPDLTASLLGRGLSLGAEIEYADQETLRSALEGRSNKF